MSCQMHEVLGWPLGVRVPFELHEMLYLTIPSPLAENIYQLVRPIEFKRLMNMALGASCQLHETCRLSTDCVYFEIPADEL